VHTDQKGTSVSQIDNFFVAAVFALIFVSNDLMKRIDAAT
jgi:hypothetical protein